jgi:hypothetical protein
MPAKDRAWRDQPMPPQHLRQPPDQRGEDRAIRPVQAGLRVDSAQHGDFMTQHQELDVLGRRRAAEQQQQVQQLKEDQVEQTQRHGARSCLPAGHTDHPGQRRRPTSGTPQVSAAHDWHANPTPGPASTATTKPSASRCTPSSTTSASPPPEPPQHRQLFVDRGSASD